MAHTGAKANSLNCLFMKKENELSCLFDHNIISNGIYQVIRNNIVAKKTTELVLLFHKNITKLIFLWPNIGQRIFKVLRDNEDTIFFKLQKIKKKKLSA